MEHRKMCTIRAEGEKKAEWERRQEWAVGTTIRQRQRPGWKIGFLFNGMQQEYKGLYIERGVVLEKGSVTTWL